MFRVRIDEQWVWLEPRPLRLRLRQAGLTLTLLVAALAGIVVTPTLPGAAATALVVALLAVAAWWGHRTWRVGSTRLGASPDGVLTQAGASATVHSWEAIESIELLPVSARRVGVRVDVPGQPVTIADAVGAGVARQWLRAAAPLAPPTVRLDEC